MEKDAHGRRSRKKRIGMVKLREKKKKQEKGKKEKERRKKEKIGIRAE